MKYPVFPASLATALALLALGASAAPAPSKVQTAVQAQEQVDKNAASSQKKIDKVSAGTQDMLNQYLDITQQTDQLRAYDDQLQQVIQAQQDQVTSLNQQNSQVGVVEQGLLPLMASMVSSLEQYVKLDIPFRLDDRLARVQQLRALISNPTASPADKFQKLVQAYDDEIAAGKTVEAYRGDLVQGSNTRTVNFLRVGHLALAYQTLDRSETGYWDKAKHQWVKADDFQDAVSQALAIANKQAAPDLMELPVPAPEVAK